MEKKIVFQKFKSLDFNKSTQLQKLIKKKISINAKRAIAKIQQSFVMKILE